MESRWTSKISKSNLRGQNSITCSIIYIIGKLLERRCLNGLTLLIWTSETQVIAKRRAGSQTTSLTPDQNKSGIDPIYLATENLRHTIGNLSMRATTLLQTALRSEVYLQNYGAPKLRESRWRNFGTPTRKSQERKTIWMWASWRGPKYTIKGKVVASPKSGLW